MHTFSNSDIESKDLMFYDDVKTDMKTEKVIIVVSSSNSDEKIIYSVNGYWENTYPENKSHQFTLVNTSGINFIIKLMLEIKPDSVLYIMYNNEIVFDDILYDFDENIIGFKSAAKGWYCPVFNVEVTNNFVIS